MPELEASLDRYAELIVRAGLNLREGQQLILEAPIEAVDVVRRIVAAAYRAGASLVTPFFGDQAAVLARYAHAKDLSFDTAPAWLYSGIAEGIRDGAARLVIIGDDPALLKGQDPEKVSRANRASSLARKPYIDLITNFSTNWCVVAAATPVWAQSVFPSLEPDAALAALWAAILKCSRADREDALTAWASHSRLLGERRDRLNAKRFAALKYTGPGTDLTIGLVDDHVWGGGASLAKNGIVCHPNIPTEEVFTMPHRERVNGWVRSTKPLSYSGTFIEGINVRFENGRIVEGGAAKGGEVFQKMLETDEGAARLGEVALVPHSSPISASGIIFNETLFDENAACHIALGEAYTENLKGADTMGKDERLARGMNSSLIHEDWMIGSADVDIDGVFADGSSEPLMRKGEWA